jgi:hypothetical protein
MNPAAVWDCSFARNSLKSTVESYGLRAKKGREVFSILRYQLLHLPTGNRSVISLLPLLRSSPSRFTPSLIPVARRMF